MHRTEGIDRIIGTCTVGGGGGGGGGGSGGGGVGGGGDGDGVMVVEKYGQRKPSVD